MSVAPPRPSMLDSVERCPHQRLMTEECVFCRRQAEEAEEIRRVTSGTHRPVPPERYVTRPTDAHAVAAALDTAARQVLGWDTVPCGKDAFRVLCVDGTVLEITVETLFDD